MDSNENLLSVLTREGVLIKVGISYWRGNKKLRPEDIGLERKALSERLISLGHKRLLPRDCLQELALIEGRAHALIDYHTFPFLNGLGHFLPNAKVEDVMGRLEGLKREFWAAKGAFLDRYASLRESASREWRVMAENLVKNPDELVETIEQSFPYPSRMERYYAFNIQCFQIALPEGLAAEMVAAGDQRAVVEARQRAAVEAQSRIREEVETFVGDCVASLREQTAVLCEEMLGSINGSENGVHQKTLNRLVRFIDQFKGMNFANDRVMEEQLEQVRRELLSRTAGEYRDSATARARLKQGLSRLASGARQLAGQETAGLVQRFGELGRRKFNLAA
ncbi:MAG: DUF3150 domain-containing protein [Verrucomicrobiota bacterium]|jgi:hypothetical protein|nr:DUF3150 domain-containing protein [Verrucomicrobiota bacterium]